MTDRRAAPARSAARAPSGRPPARGARTAPNRRRARQHRSHRTFVIVISISAVALIAQLVRVQVLDAASYSSYATSEIQQKVTLPATRGAIYDRNGDLLAISVERYDVIADDFLVTDPRADASVIAPILHERVGSLTAELSRRDGYVVLARQVLPATEASIASLALEGITFQDDPLRESPGGALFQPLLGSVNAAGLGDAALEYQYNDLLEGSPGSEVVSEDPDGAELPGGATDVQPSRQGESLVLTIDEPLQNEVTRDVTKQMIATDADSGIAVVEGTQSGDILAMVDLVRGPKNSIVPASSNLAVTSVYQPGSVMKLATIGYSLQDGLISPNSDFTVPYSINVGGYTFQDADFHGTEILPAKQILAQSSNVGTIEISRLLGMQRLYQGLQDLGFTKPSGLDWPGESAGIVGDPTEWVGSDAASVPIGTGVAVTPMQILDAYNSVANGGVMVTPKLVAATINSSGVEHTTPATPTRRTFAPSTVSELVPMLAGVVCDEDGTAILARVPGYTVAGKTGTAQVPAPDGEGYIPGDWNASFVGFVPAQDPKLSGIVVLNHRGGVVYGGTESAPVFAQIMQYALAHFDVPPPTAVSARAANTPTSISCSPGQ